MKLQLDTTRKTVKVEEDVKVSALINVLKRLLPEDWKDFTLQTNVTISYWNDPIIIKRTPWHEYPWYCGTMLENSAKGTNEMTTEYKLQNGTYNLEVNDTEQV